MTSHRPEDIHPSVRITIHRDQPDDELPPLLYYSTCIARGSDPTIWADERGSSYWLNHHMLEIPSVEEPVEEPAASEVAIQTEKELELFPVLTYIQPTATPLNLPKPLTDRLWPPVPEFKYVGPVISDADPTWEPDFLPDLREFKRGPNLLIPYKGWPGPREAPVPVSPLPEAPTVLIPVIQPGDESPTQLLPLVPQPVVPELFGATEPADPPDQELTTVWHRQPFGGST